MITRRKALAFLVAAPAIVRIGSLMKLSILEVEPIATAVWRMRPRAVLPDDTLVYYFTQPGFWDEVLRVPCGSTVYLPANPVWM